MLRLILIFVMACGFALKSFAAPDAAEFGKLPSVYDAAISPDAKRIALIVNIKGRYGIFVFKSEELSNKPDLKMFDESAKPQWIKWVNNDRVLTGIWQSEKIGTTPLRAGYIYTLNAKTMKGKILVKPRNIFRQFNDRVIDFLPHDPDHILMSFSDTDAFAPDIKRVNVATGSAERIKKDRRTIQKWYTDLRGTPRIGQGRIDNISKEEWRLTIRDADSNDWKSYKKYPGLTADVDIFGFTRDPNELIIRKYAGKDTQGFYIYNLLEKRETRKLFHNESYDVRAVIYNPEGTDVVGVSYISDTRVIELFEEEDTILSRMRRDFPDYTIDFVDQSRDGDFALFKMSSAYDAGALMLYNQNVDKVQRISLYHKGLPKEDMGDVTSVRYTARDGFKIPAYVTLPPAITDASQIKKLPFIILPRGGGYARESKQFDYFAQFFATRGFGVLQMNYRGSAGYGKSFKDAGRKNWIVMQEDVEDGTRWLIEKGYADPDRTCIAGWAYGGYAALMGAIKNPELYACSISMAGITDLYDAIRDLKKYRFGKLSAKNFILNGFEDNDAIKENSPVRRAKDYTVPLFLAHGEKDQRVHFDQYKRMKKALKNSPATVTYMEFEDEDHYLSNQKNRQQFLVGLEKFLNETVGESEFKRS